MKWNTLKRYKVLAVLILTGFGTVLMFSYAEEQNILRMFKHLATKVVPSESPQQHNSSKQEESLPVYFYKKQSDMINPFHGCKHKCHLINGFSTENNAVIVFQAPNLLDLKPLQKYPGQLWVFFSMESPTYHPPSSKLKMWKNVFNWTLGYRRDADILHTYGRFNLLPETKKPINVSSSWNSRSNKSIAFVSHCGAASKRLTYMKIMNTSYGVDIYGGCGKLKCSKSNWGKCLDNIRNYKFYLSFENSVCKDYITEKMFKIFWSNLYSIPIGRGGTQYELFLPPKSYIDTSKYQSTKELAEHMWRLSKNETEASVYFKWGSSYFADRGTNSGFCELCRRIHDSGLTKKHRRLYRDVDTWLRGSELTQICKTPSDLV